MVKQHGEYGVTCKKFLELLKAEKLGSFILISVKTQLIIYMICLSNMTSGPFKIFPFTLDKLIMTGDIDLRTQATALLYQWNHILD